MILKSAILSPCAMAAAVFVAFIHLAWLMTGDTLAANGVFIDGDSYMRLVRVDLLVESGSWFDNSILRSNVPFGASMHWTRLFDIALLSIALPLTPLFGFAKALYMAGAYISPLLHVLTALGMAWALVPVVGRTAAAIAGGLSAVQPGLMAYAVAGHADHHIFYILLVVITLGFVLRLLSDSAGDCERSWRNNALAAGAFSAVAIWLGVEALLFLGLCLLVMGFIWVAGKPHAAAKNFYLSLGLALALTLVLLVEQGPGHYLDVEFDSVSIVHLSMAALLLAFWTIVRFCQVKVGVIRLLAGISAAALISAILIMLYPGIIKGAMSGINPETMPFVKMVGEYHSVESIAKFLLLFGGAVFAVPWLLWRLSREWHGADRWPWIMVGICSILYLSLGVTMLRWAPYAGVFLAVLLSGMIVEVDAYLSIRLQGPGRVLVKVGIIVLLIIGPTAVGIAATKTENISDTAKTCVLRQMANYLNKGKFAERPFTILASANLGPELLYRTGHKVIATLHHRNVSGIIDGAAILAGHDEGEILKLINKRQVDLIILCPGSSHDSYFNIDDKLALYSRLVDGDFPDWIHEVIMPAGIGEGFRLFRVF